MKSKTVVVWCFQTYLCDAILLWCVIWYLSFAWHRGQNKDKIEKLVLWPFQAADADHWLLLPIDHWPTQELINIKCWKETNDLQEEEEDYYKWWWWRRSLSVSWERAERCQYLEKYVLRGRYTELLASSSKCRAVLSDPLCDTVCHCVQPTHTTELSLSAQGPPPPAQLREL